MGSQRGHGLSASFAHAGGCCGRLHGIGWVIAGGESGPSARPVNPAWPRHLRGQCTAAGVPFFFKQWGTWVHDPAAPTGSPLHRRAGKAFPDHKTLDGATWRQFPDTGRSTAA
jgi:protein gp37